MRNCLEYKENEKKEASISCDATITNENSDTILMSFQLILLVSPVMSESLIQDVPSSLPIRFGLVPTNLWMVRRFF